MFNLGVAAVQDPLLRNVSFSEFLNQEARILLTNKLFQSH